MPSKPTASANRTAKEDVATKFLRASLRSISEHWRHHFVTYASGAANT